MLSEREPCRRAGGLDERGLVDEIELVQDNGKPVDERRVAALSGRQVERLALLIDPGVAIGEPEADLERRVSDGAGERVAHLSRLDVVELDDEVADIATRAVDEEQPGDAKHHVSPEPGDVDPVLLDLRPEIGAPQVGESDQGEERRVDQRRDEHRAGRRSRRWARMVVRHTRPWHGTSPASSRATSI